MLCAENADKESVGKECLFNKDKEQHNNNRGCDTLPPPRRVSSLGLGFELRNNLGRVFQFVFVNP